MPNFFSESELSCHCGCGANKFDPHTLNRCNVLREVMGIPLIMVSGYRCPRYNSLVSDSGENGPHTHGRAGDFSVSGLVALKLIVAAKELGFTGFGLKQHGANRFVHLDDLPNHYNQPRPWIWTYNL